MAFCQSTYQLRLLALCLAAFSFCGRAAEAQITVGTPQTSSSITGNATGDGFPPGGNPGTTATDLSSTGVVQLGYKGDWSYTLFSDTPELVKVDFTAYLPFSVGGFPIRLSNLSLNVNAKWINASGGVSTDPSTSWVVDAAVHESRGTGLPHGPLIVDKQFSDSLVGDGSKFDSGPATNAASLNLAAGVSYFLEIDLSTTIDARAFDSNNDPTISVSNEFGGSHSGGANGLTGFSARFDYASLPEPGTGLGAILGLGAWLLRRRRSV